MNRQERSSDPGPPSAVSPARLWLFRAMAVLLVPIALLGVTELVLRAVGYGHSTAYVERVEQGGRELLRDNPRFYTLFFPDHLLPRQLPFVLDREKPAGRVRVVLLGGSAAMGIPEPAVGMAPMMQVQLRHRHPDADIEVLNLANTAINSHVVRRIADELGPLAPDVLVVYLGNNEVVGPFGAGTIFTGSTPSRTTIAAQIWLRSTRLGQALVALGRRLRAGDTLPGRWRGMAMFADRSIAPDDPSLDRVREHFRDNLAAIVEAGRGLGVPVVIASVAVNQRHCAPFASLNTPGVDPVRFGAAFDSANVAWERGDLDLAEQRYRDALALDEGHADLRYRYGRLAILRGDTVAAREHLLAAVQRDGLRFRADRQVNEIIREVAAAEGAIYAPVAEAMSRVSPFGLPGREVLFEHVHFDLQGNRLAAQVLVQQVESALGTRLEDGDGQGWPTVEELTRRLGMTVFDRYQQVSSIGALVSQPPFTALSDQPEQLARLSRELDALRPRIESDRLPALWPIYEEAMRLDPQSWILRFRAASFLNEGLGDGARAEPLWRRLTHELEHFPAAWNGYARALALQGRADAARLPLERSLALDPHQVDVKLQLAAVLRAAEPRDVEARWKALALEEEGLEADGSEASLRRLLNRYREDQKWFATRARLDRANDLAERAAALAKRLRSDASGS